MRKIKYQCGHYAKSKFGQCQKNTIPAEWIEAEVIEYTKLLVRNKQFAEDIQGQLVHCFQRNGNRNDESHQE